MEWKLCSLQQLCSMNRKITEYLNCTLKDKWELVLGLKTHTLRLKTQDKVLDQWHPSLKGGRRQEVKGAWIYRHSVRLFLVLNLVIHFCAK